MRARDGIRHISGMDVLVVAFSFPDNSHISSCHRLCKHPHSPGYHLDRICSISMCIGADVAVIAFAANAVEKPGWTMRMFAQPPTRNIEKIIPPRVGIDFPYRIEEN